MKKNKRSKRKHISHCQRCLDVKKRHSKHENATETVPEGEHNDRHNGNGRSTTTQQAQNCQDNGVQCMDCLCLCERDTGRESSLCLLWTELNQIVLWEPLVTRILHEIPTALFIGDAMEQKKQEDAHFPSPEMPWH